MAELVLELHHQMHVMQVGGGVEGLVATDKSVVHMHKRSAAAWAAKRP